ncbi:MAG: flagellar protein FliT [Dehalococcoidia bacterium]
MSDALIEAALAISRDRHNAIRQGDLEAYASLEEQLATICSEVAAQELTEADIPVLDELIGIETQSRAILQDLMDETSGRLDSLRHGSTANGAYLRAERLSVNRR